MNVHSKKNETLQLFFLGAFCLIILSVFFFTPSLRPASLLTILNVLLLSPIVDWCEKRKISRLTSILGLYLILSMVFVFGVIGVVQTLIGQWSSLVRDLPTLSYSALNKLNAAEGFLKREFGIELGMGAKAWITQAGSTLRGWALQNLPSFAGSLATNALLVPIFSFFILKDGQKMMREFFTLIPESYKDSSTHALKKISRSLSKFLRAKTLEAFFVGIMSYLGLKLIGAPYAGIFSVIAGLANIIPYLGPILGAAPPILMVFFTESASFLLVPTILVFVIVNAIDLLLIFPIFVSRLVNLSPLTLLASVAVGQEIYGITGMLLAVPCASIIKIIAKEMMGSIYPERKPI